MIDKAHPRLSFLFLSALIAGCAPALESPPAAKISSNKASIPFEPIGNRTVVRGTLNGRVSAYFLVDTGATLTMISRVTAKELGIDLEKRIPTIPVQTVGGLTNVPVVVLDSIEIGGMQVNHITVAVYDPQDPYNTGLLGVNFLSGFRVEIDLRDGVLVLEKR